MILLLLTGKRVFGAIGFVAVAASLLLWGDGGSEMAFSAAMKLMKWYPMLTLPMFVFMGYMLSESRIADDLYRMFHVWAGPLHGGLAIGTIGLMVVISAMNGLSVAGMAIGASIAYTIEGLVRIGEFHTLRPGDGHIDPERLLTSLPGIGPQLARTLHERLGIATLEELERASLIEPCTDSNNGRRCSVTPQGNQAVSRIVEVRRAHVRRAAAEWRTDEHEAVPLSGIEEDLVPDPRTPR